MDFEPGKTGDAKAMRIKFGPRGNPQLLPKTILQFIESAKGSFNRWRNLTHYSRWAERK
jgi:hypothetical protein